MAFTTGTATSFKDLLNKLRLYATDAARGADQWTTMRYTTGAGAEDADELILRGPGSGADEIFVGVKTQANIGADYYNWQLAGFTGYDGGLAFEAQPGYMSKVWLTLWNSNIPYWFILNGRRIIVVAKVSTSYVSAYLGFLHSYASPNLYPYPLAIGGNLAGIGFAGLAANSTSWRWSNGTADNSNFFATLTAQSSVGALNDQLGQLKIRHQSGVWFPVLAGYTSAFTSAILSSTYLFGLWPRLSMLNNVMRRAAGPANNVSLIPSIVVGNDLLPDMIGELDGVFWISGYTVAAEDIVQYGGVDHLIVQNVNRTNLNAYAAIRLS